MKRSTRSALLLSTSGLALLAAGTSGGYAQYFDIMPGGALPAVSGVNGVLEPFGGTLSGDGFFGARGAVTTPLDHSYGFQVDGLLGTWDGDTLTGVAGHLFWRDPAQAMLGLYASYTDWSKFGGVDLTQIGGEAEYYWQQFTLRGVAGVESGGSTSRTTVTAAPMAVGGSYFTQGVTATWISEVETRFFDQVDLVYYVTPDADVYVGHRYLAGENALALGGDWAFPVTLSTEGALFVEARIGEDDFNGVWGGAKFLFGQTPKPLIGRDREDHANFWDFLFTSRTESSRFCPPGYSLAASSVPGLC